MDKALLIKVEFPTFTYFLSFYVNKRQIGALIFNITAWLRPFHNRWLEKSEIYQLVVNSLDIWYLFYIEHSLHFFQGLIISIWET